MQFKRILYVILVFFFIFGFPERIDAQAHQAVRKVTKKIVKKTAKNGAEEISEQALKHGDVILGNQAYRINMRKQLKNTLKKEGVKSFLEFSRKKSNNIFIPSSGLQTNPSNLTKKFATIYENSLKKGVKTFNISHSGKILLKMGSKEYLIPTGKQSIKIVWNTRLKKYEPAVKSLSDGSEAAIKFNALLLRERRKAISPYNQFITADQVKKYDKSNLILGKEANGGILRENMYRAMPPENRKIQEAFGGAAAHHVVEGKNKYADLSREILKKHKIDINAPENGIFLPTDANSIFKGSVHKTNHNYGSHAYSEYVYSKIKDAKNQDEIFERLQKIKYELYEGKLTLEGPKHLYNSNKL